MNRNRPPPRPLEPPSIDPAARPLLRAFRAQRPIRAGSLLLTIFGDAVAPRGGEIALASLIELSRPFGLSERLVRTSIGRLAQDDWLETTRVGRLSYYRLTTRGRQEFAVATRRIYGPAMTEWTGTWTLILMPGIGAAEREAIAEELGWRGLGQPMPGVLAYPGERVEEVRQVLAAHAVGTRALVLSSATACPKEDARLAALGWNLADLEDRYARFVRQFEPVAQAVQNTPPSALTCFVIRTLLIHAYRRIHLRDPLLPPSLLPPSWSGAAAARLTQTLYKRIFERAEAFLSRHAVNRAGFLPSAGPEALGRFGGVGG